MTYRLWKYRGESRVYASDLIKLPLIGIVFNETHPGISVALRVDFDAILELADLVMWKPRWRL